MTKKYFSPRFLALVAWLVGACGSSSENIGTTTNGVNDVREACEIRTAWTQAATPTCIECLAFAMAPRCECQHEEYAGVCSEQQGAKNREPSCDGTDACVNGCNTGDCDCVDACYAGKDTCHPLGSAVDGCLAATCDSYCR